MSRFLGKYDFYQVLGKWLFFRKSGYYDLGHVLGDSYL